MNIKNILTGVVLGLAFCAPLLQADDTEIYTGSGAPPGASGPIVMLNLDVRPNVGSTTCNGTAACMSFLGASDSDPNDLWDNLSQETKDRLATGSGSDKNLRLLELFSVVLHKVMSDLLARNFTLQIGIMLNHAHNQNCDPGDPQCSNGAYVFESAKTLDQDYADRIKERLQFVATIENTVAGGSSSRTGDASSHSFQGKELYFELMRYLTGQTIYNGHQGFTSFDSHNDQKGDNLDLDWGSPVSPDPVNKPWLHASWDPAAEDGDGTYASPLDPNAPCAAVYAINVLHQVSQQEDGSDTAIEASKASGGTGAPRQTFPDMIQFMHDADLADPNEFPGSPDVDGIQGLISYFLSGNVNTTTNGYAQAGGTGAAFDLDLPPDELIERISDIFLEILSVSTTFVAAAIPVNAFNRATVTNNVYFALFQAEAGPVWPGNLKRLRITSGQTLVDETGANAIAADGRIKAGAITFWTDPQGIDVQTADPDEGEIAGADGRSVKRGGAGQQIPGFLSADPSVRGDPGENNADSGARKVFTEPASFTNGTPGTALQAFNADDTALATALQSDLGATSTTQAQEYMRWLRGYAIDDLDNDPSTVDVRDWFLADALHSRPVPVNYGLSSGYSGSNQNIRIIFGTNDGFFHMFRNSEPGSTGTPDGKEVWAFAPREALGNTGTLRLDQTNTDHPYGTDGAATLYTIDTDEDGTIESAEGDRVYTYFGLRRGGKSYYALNITDPDSPKIMWSVKKTTGGDTDELALTFAQPQNGQVQYGAGAKPVVAVSGGYNGKDGTADQGKDDRTGIGSNDDEGNAIYFLNANDGSVVWKATKGASTGTQSATLFHHASLVDSIPAEVALLDTNANGNIDRFYVADSAGRLWRGDTPDNTPESDDRNKWALTLLADLGRHAVVSPSGSDDRRAFHRVDAVLSNDENGPYYAIILGTGDRANPKEITHDNKLFVIKDRKVFNTTTGTLESSGLPYDIDDLGDITDNCIQEETCGGTTPNLTNGWFLTLAETGEKALSAPLTISGTIFFSSYLPNAGAAGSVCLPNEGGGRAYAVRLDNGGAAFNLNTANDTSTQELFADDRYVTLTTPGIPPDPVFVPPVVEDEGGSNGGLCTDPDADLDGDGIINSADPDDDNDGVADATDNCVCEPNADQSDVDSDGIGDVCEATNNNACNVLVGTTFLSCDDFRSNTFWYQVEDPNTAN